jgi:hypothetical protein
VVVLGGRSVVAPGQVVTGVMFTGFPVAVMTGLWGFPGTGTSVTVTGGATVFPVGPAVTGFPGTGTAVAVVDFGTPDTVHTGDT